MPIKSKKDFAVIPSFRFETERRRAIGAISDHKLIGFQQSEGIQNAQGQHTQQRPNQKNHKGFAIGPVEAELDVAV
jgi:hypothetical protein